MGGAREVDHLDKGLASSLHLARVEKLLGVSLLLHPRPVRGNGDEKSEEAKKIEGGVGRLRDGVGGKAETRMKE
jgi:hypothetical protein